MQSETEATGLQDLAKDLNEMQRMAVEYNEGPMLVIAGAGSGKTRMLTYKVAYLLRQGVNAWNILALTFTNKAANEMKERIGRLAGEAFLRYINMGTFHSVFSRILRAEAEAIGFTSRFSIYDEGDSLSLIKAIVRDMGLDDKMYKPSAVHKRISLAKNNMINDSAYAADPEIYERDRQARLPAIGKIFTAYEQRCSKANAIDFDDLLLLTYRLFRDNEDIRAKWEDRFKYILVDEYQDTNKVQQAVLEQLTRTNKHICVVGDDAQSIYAFRGANLENILSFNAVYPSARLFKLEQNYRSTGTIVKAANSLISHNKKQIAKDIFSRNGEGERLLLKRTSSDREEAVAVCNEIKRIQWEEGCEYSDFAVLYRTNAQSRSFEEAFRKRNIPYRVYGGLSFYQRKEIKDIIAYFRLTVNPDDEEAFRRIINYPARGIGQTTVAHISDTALNSGVSMWTVCNAPETYSLNISGAAKGRVGDFVRLISSFRSRAGKEDAYSLGQDIIVKSGIYADIFASNDVEDLTRQENISEFENALNNFVEECKRDGREGEATLDRFLQEVSLQSERDNDAAEDTPKTALMTVHAAKGLEFKTVFVVGLDENIFPSSRSISSLRELEEERRLLYVAITRAEKHCILTCAKNRMRYGKPEYFVPSRFVSEIDRRYLDVEQEEEPPQTSLFSSDKDGKPFFRRIQNSRPVASQFRADVEYKITDISPKEKPVDPFSPAFRQLLDAAKGKYRPSNGGYRSSNGGFDSGNTAELDAADNANAGYAKPSGKGNAAAYKGLREGMTIEHSRFGRGIVANIEGEGDNAKATVDFESAGRKQLLLKFAKFSIVK